MGKGSKRKVTYDEESILTGDDINIEELIDTGITANIITQTVSEEERQNIKSNNEYLEVLSIWKKEKRTDQIMKIALSGFLGLMLLGQIIYINVIIFKIGLKKMDFNEWTIRLYITGVFVEIVALVKIVVQNLFPANGSKDFLEFLNSFYGTRNNVNSEEAKNKEVA